MVHEQCETDEQYGARGRDDSQEPPSIHVSPPLLTLLAFTLKALIAFTL